MLVKYSSAFVVLPEGGTFDELFGGNDADSDPQIARFPVVLMDKAFWAEDERLHQQVALSARRRGAGRGSISARGGHARAPR